MISLNSIKLFLVVGASNNSEKFGYKIVDFLKRRNFTVVPINPKEKEILGVKCFSSISAFFDSNKSKINKSECLVVFVIPPEKAFSVLKEAVLIGLKNFWFQPGSESQKALEYCKSKNVFYSFEKCVMVELGKNNKL